MVFFKKLSTNGRAQRGKSFEYCVYIIDLHDFPQEIINNWAKNKNEENSREIKTLCPEGSTPSAIEDQVRQAVGQS